MCTVTNVIRQDGDEIVDELGEQLAPLEGTHLLMTGVAGFLCSYFLDIFDAFNRRNPDRPVRVSGLDLFRDGIPERLVHLTGDPNIQLVAHDATRPFEPEGDVDWIIHGASIASPIYYRRDPLGTIDVNVNGTWRLLELAEERGCKSFLYFSSSEIYGNPDPAHVPTDESYLGNVSCTGPRACYDESKRLGETLCMTFYRKHGTPVKIIRPFNVYGPGQQLSDQRIVPDLMSGALRGGPLVLLSDGRATRSFCYVGDFAAASLLVLLSDQDGEVFNVGNDEEISIADAARTLSEVAADPPIQIDFQTSVDSDYLTDNPERRCPDLSKVKRALPWRPKLSLREGFERTIRSYRENGA